VTEALRVPDGDEIVAFVAALPAGSFVAAAGWVEGVELSVTRSGADEVRAVPGRVALLSLSGPAPGPLMVVLSRPDGEGVVGGRLLKARSAGVAVGVTAGAAVTPAAAARADRTAAGTNESGAKPATAAPPSQAASGWAALATIPREDDDETDEAPKFGDRVNHFVFGLCDVMVVRGERMKIRDVHGPGRLREIHLNAVKVLAPTVEDGKRVFKLAKRT
jgi:hypothetical protein